jgi:hypothetical protein
MTGTPKTDALKTAAPKTAAPKTDALKTEAPPFPADATARAIERLRRAVRPAVETAIAASLSTYDRQFALTRFHRLPAETVAAETPEAARAVVREIERALRSERARRGHWTYDLNRHIALLVAHRAESARAARLSARG